MRNAIIFLLAAFPLVLLSSQARAETTECNEITSVPTVINVQGVYCLKQNLSTPSPGVIAIDIQTNNVTIDFNGFKLGNLAAGPSSISKGISAIDRQNITIRNGAIRGFETGIDFKGSTGSSGHLIEDMILDKSLIFAIKIAGSGHIIRNNQIVGTGTIPADSAVTTGVFAINPVSFTDSVIENNLFSGIRTLSSAYAIFLDTDTVNPQRNAIRGNVILDIDAAVSGVGMFINNGEQTVVSGNTIKTVHAGTGTAFGIQGAGSSVLYCFDNIVTNVDDAQTSGCDVEDNTRPMAP